MTTYVWRILLSAVVAVVSTMIGGMVASALGLPSPQLPEVIDMRRLLPWMFVGGLVLSLSLAGISCGLNGIVGTRWFMLAWFVYASMGINNTIEASIFTSLGGTASLLASQLFPCVILAGTVATLFPGPEPFRKLGVNARDFFAARSLKQWTVRLAAALVVFPAIYTLFGAPVGMVVAEHYRDESFGLRLSSMPVILGVQFLRSGVFLLACLPIVITWSRSRRALIVALGLGLFVVVGLYGLIQAYWMPSGMRILHCVEILGDSFVYGGMLVTLLVPRAKTAVGETTPRPCGRTGQAHAV